MNNAVSGKLFTVLRASHSILLLILIVFENHIILLFVVLPEERCDSTTLKCTAGSYCVNSKCKCMNGQIYRNGLCQAPSLVKVGESCVANERCPQNAHCSLRKVCECLSDYFPSRGVCEPKPKEGFMNFCNESSFSISWKCLSSKRFLFGWIRLHERHMYMP